MTTYTPRPGTIADKAIRALASGPMTVAQLCEAIGREYAGIHADLRIPMRHGVIVRTTLDGHAAFMLGDGYAPAPEAGSRFSAALWTDGTMALMNVETTSGDRAAVELTSRQVEMIRGLLAGKSA